MRRRSNRQAQKINTSALPDIIFMILFFFMVVGKVPAPVDAIDTDVPELVSGDDLKDTSKYVHIRIGVVDGEVVAQVGYDVVSLEDLPAAIKNQDRRFAVLHIDGSVGSGVIEYIVKPALVSSGVHNFAIIFEHVDIQ